MIVLSLSIQKKSVGAKTPRHLIVFNWNSLEAILTEEGFYHDCRYPRTDCFVVSAAKSRAIKNGTDPYKSKITLLGKLLGLVAKFQTSINRRHSEIVTVQFVKPKIK